MKNKRANIESTFFLQELTPTSNRINGQIKIETEIFIEKKTEYKRGYIKILDID